MKKEWENIWNAFERSDEELAAFMESANLNTLQLRRLKKFTNEWDKIKVMATEFDKFIVTKPLKIELPYRSSIFADMWERWKEYLSEQHAQILGSRSEKSALEHLILISKSNEEKAIMILRYAMANRYKNFFAIEEKDTEKPAKGETVGTGSDF